MIIAIDTGGTKTLIASFSKSGKILSSVKIKTSKNPDKYIKEISKIIFTDFSDEIAQNSVKAISIAAPGIIKNETVIWAENLGWENFKIKQAFEENFPKIPILIENDANLAGLSEAKNIENYQKKTLLYLTVSTGIGSGVITNGKINSGLKNSEPGRMKLEHNGKMQEWEKFASGKAILENYGKFAKDLNDPEIWHEISEKICHGLLVLIPLIQPETIIFGGSIGEYFEKYEEFLFQILREKMPLHIPIPDLKKAKEPEFAVIFGCYEVANEKFN